MNSKAGKPSTPQKVLLGHLREMRRIITASIRPWLVDGHGGVDAWNDVWRLANALRVKVDALAIHASQQAKAAREADYDRQQALADTAPGGTDD